MKHHQNFTILAAGPFSFSGNGCQNVIRDFPGTVGQNFPQDFPRDAVMVSIPMEKHVCPEGHLDLTFCHPDDFLSKNIIGNNPWLVNLKSAVDYISRAQAEGASVQEIYQRLCQWENLPVRFEPPAAEGERQVLDERGASALDDILNMVDTDAWEGGNAATDGAGPETWKAAVQKRLQQNLTAVLNDPVYLSTVASWKGLALLSHHCAGKDSVFLQTLALATKDRDALPETLRREFPRTRPDLLLVDFMFDSSPRSLSVIEAMALVCDEFMVPAIIGVNERFFYLKAWTDVTMLPYVPHYMDATRFAGWNRFRASSPATWLVAACTRFTIQEDDEVVPEAGTNVDEAPLCRLSPVWAAATLCVQSISACGWPTRFAGSEKEMRIEKAAAEVLIDGERAEGFVRSGFMPLSADDSNAMVFFHAESAVSGHSFCMQMLVARSVKFFLDLSDRMDHGQPRQAAEQQIRDAWLAFWSATTADPPDDSDIALSPGSSGGLVLSVSFTAPPAILPDSPAVSFSLRW
ncbi:MAG: type VI secretion system contractile sheath large subunit [Thermodesulfobacteriota bacterium]|nr:type VI secretion system contractile sheath large subunit [Thermodesulfobacteriota bacterium]